uniref:Probable nicotinate-nucleotide adenylyltransferase n=1 Tax=Candidatus Kentrum sp. MB TaxID=2138164 RepID=A0A450XQC2_9GAMM|nr:MAG: nicotinate-nucleotide adenylyltransferase [Candidatus Kentron sp. MB]VFK31511.1 MAG: nicotinate-nucleotide adenylyltransferase [Candidatus Kentron sp. MB]VFK75544.1 MAG: nicotinate-nucleotide adenylyltransferase [Candidatus Kentron sp. MB]
MEVIVNLTITEKATARDTPMLESIGILGGTFDPIHNGHLRFALEVLDGLSLSSICLIPLGRPPHRTPPRASDDVRLRMLMAAVREEPGLVVDDQELRRNGLSYTVDTLDALRQRFPHRSLCLILGADAFCQLHTWSRWRRILTLAHIVVAQRPGALLPKTGEAAHLLANRQTKDPARLREEPAGRIFVHAVPLLDISATRIRALAARGVSIRYLVPDTVLEIIIQEQLYA